MKSIFHNDLITLLFCIGSILLLARIFAEIAKKLKMPGIMGEIVLGIIIGPTNLVRYPCSLEFPTPELVTKIDQ